MLRRLGGQYLPARRDAPHHGSQGERRQRHLGPAPRTITLAASVVSVADTSIAPAAVPVATIAVAAASIAAASIAAASVAAASVTRRNTTAHTTARIEPVQSERTATDSSETSRSDPGPSEEVQTAHGPAPRLAEGGMQRQPVQARVGYPAALPSPRLPAEVRV